VSTFLNTLHVLAAVLLTGPLLAAPFAARRAIARRSTYGVRVIANLLALFGAGSLLVAALGVATVLAGDEWELTTPWVLIATTLYVVALGLIWLYAVPALRRAAHLLEAAEPAPTPESGPEPGPDRPDREATEPAPEPATAVTPERVLAISARVAGAGWLLLVTFAVITILMTTRPA
jgi:uncharacterized membrane protein